MLFSFLFFFFFWFFMMASLVLLHGNGQEGMDGWDLLCMGLGFVVELLSRPVERVTNQSITKKLDLDYCQSENYGLLFYSRSIYS